MKKETRHIRKKKLVLEIETIRLQDLQLDGGRPAEAHWTTTQGQITGCYCCALT